MKKLNRGWVKNVAIIFLAAMLILTFFSNTIANISLPEVVAAQPTSGTISNAVRGIANVEAIGSYSIEVDSSRRILAVHVREGETVEQGDPLFLLEAGENEQLSQLEGLRLNRQQMLIDLGGSDFAMQNETVRQAREDLQRARTERAALGTAEITETAAVARLDEATANLETQSGRLAQLEAELGFIDTLDSRSVHISRQVIAYEQALANFAQNVGMTYEQWLSENPSGSNQWSQSVREARRNMQTAAATQRPTVVGEISTQSETVTAAQTARANAENTLTRIQRINSAEDAVRGAERALNTALITLSDQQQQDNIAHQKRLLDLSALEQEIAELEEQLHRQSGGTEGGDVTITAQFAGIITGLTAVAGQTAEMGIPLARIEVAELGYTAQLQVDARQAAQIRPGAVVEVSSMNWFADISGNVTNVRVDPDDAASGRIITVGLEGSVTIGEQVSLAVHISNTQHETIVPRSALGQDATGYHVYVLETRSSPLGTRYMAVRVDVTIEAEGETTVAIRGDLDRFANVIIRSSATLSDRDAVRLAAD